ncbi:B12-binding domain-containing protein [[Kitasatospora] papulosa]|uniref:B12-binding domain-containing protein n=1 Tax=Streptomyces TaxID=1883 RepID=UPI0031B646B8
MSTSRPPRLPHTTHLEQAAAQLWGAVRAADEYTATGLVLRLLDEGAEPESVLLDVIARVQGQVGKLRPASLG